MVIAIHQPNFFPWFGYFLKIYRSDIFVFLDDVQIQKTGNSFTSRVAFCVQGNAMWFTVPIKRTAGTQNINETDFLNNKWQKKLVSTLQINYSKSPFYDENKDFVFSLVSYNTESLCEFNIYTIKKMVSYLEFDRRFIRSSEYGINDSSTQRLVDIILKLKGNKYLSGTGADKYQDPDLYQANNIEMIHNEFIHPVYQQVNKGTFVPNLTILDLLFNLGREKLIVAINNCALKAD